MNKTLCILMLFNIAAGLVLCCGCAGKISDGQETTPSVSPSPAQNTTDQIGAVNRESLNRLKDDLEDLEFDDPGGLTGE